MTQTIDLPKLRTFDLLSPAEQAAIRRHCQNVVALALRRKYGTVAEHVPDPDVAHMPEPTPRKFTRPQLEMGFANYPEKAEKRKEVRWWRPSHEPGPPAAPKPSKKGQRRRGPKPMMGSGARR